MVRNIEPAGAGLQMTLPQEISLRTLPLLERQVDDAIAQRAAALEMHAAAVHIIDSAGLNWLLGASARLEVAGIPLKILDASPVMLDVFLATRLDSRFILQTSESSGGIKRA